MVTSVSSPGQSNSQPARKPPAGDPTPPALPVATPRTRVASILSLVVAVVVLVGFALLVRQMLAIAGDATDSLWSRQLVIFNAVQALAFGAAGLLFGNRIERINTLAANSVANQARQELVDARENARLAIENGAWVRRRLAEIAGPSVIASTEAARDKGPQLGDLLNEATRLFPED